MEKKHARKERHLRSPTHNCCKGGIKPEGNYLWNGGIKPGENQLHNGGIKPGGNQPRN